MHAETSKIVDHNFPNLIYFIITSLMACHILSEGRLLLKKGRSQHSLDSKTHARLIDAT